MGNRTEAPIAHSKSWVMPDAAHPPGEFGQLFTVTALANEWVWIVAKLDDTYLSEILIHREYSAWILPR